MKILRWKERMPEPWIEKVCDMNCSPREVNRDNCDDCMPVRKYGDPIVARDAEIAELRAALLKVEQP